MERKDVSQMISIKKNRSEKAFIVMCIISLVIPLLILAILIGDIIHTGFSRITLDFILSFPSRKAEQAGILPALVGSVYLIFLTAIFAVPIGVGAAIYLEEYNQKTWISTLIETNISNLAGVPSIIYGLLGLELFVRFCQLGRSLLAGSLTMALLILPIIVQTSREALRTVPRILYEGCYALGATRWQAIKQVALPMAFPGILTGVILSVSRAIGETAPLIVIGALAYVTFLPDGIDAPFTVLPIQIFNWISRPQQAFHENAAAAILILLLTMLFMNAVAIYFRNRYQKQMY